MDYWHSYNLKTARHTRLLKEQAGINKFVNRTARHYWILILFIEINLRLYLNCYLFPMPKLNYSNLWTYDLYGPLLNALMRANPFRGQIHNLGKWEGVGPWKLRLFGPCEIASNLQANAIWGPKKSIFPGPYPLPLAQVMDLPASKALNTGPFQSQVNGYFYVHELPGPIDRLWGRVREHSALNLYCHTAPSPSAVNLNHQTYWKSTGNCNIHKGTLWYIKCTVRRLAYSLDNGWGGMSVACISLL